MNPLPQALSYLRRRYTLALPPRSHRKGVVRTTGQLSKLIFCHAVFKETLRLKPPTPLNFAHCKVRVFW